MGSLSYRTVKNLLEIEEVRELEESGRMGFMDQRREFAQLPEKQHKHVRPLSVYQEQLSLFKH